MPLFTARLKVAWESISTSYWFIPVCMMLLSVALCYSCLAIIERADLPDSFRPFIPVITQEGAQQLLSTVATAMVTATSIAFSMTIVALTLASSQFGPRLIRNFMLDKGTQAVLGILVSTFVFCLLALHHLSAITENQDAISLLAAAAMFLAIIDSVTIIYFIHHVSTSIQADQVIAKCFVQFINQVESLLPLPESNAKYKGVNEAWIKPDNAFTRVIDAKMSGYIQTINYTDFLRVDSQKIQGSEIVVRSGDHVVEGEAIFIIYSYQPLLDSDVNYLQNSIVIGSSRTPIQDPEFAISQLVEIALRALSPGINDPYTAMTCIDKLTAACSIISQRVFPEPCLIHTQTEVFVKRRTFDFAGVINTSFDQIRQASEGHVAVLIHLLHSLATLQAKCDPEKPTCITRQAENIYCQAQKSPVCEQDLQAIKHAYLHFQSNGM